MSTGNGEKYLRMWFEVSQTNTSLPKGMQSYEHPKSTKWFPYNKGGAFRKWYGNREYVVNFFGDGQQMKADVEAGVNQGYRMVSREWFFLPGITWTDVSISFLAARAVGPGFIFTALPPRTPRSPSRATSRPRSARRRVLVLMLGDTSMGMINGYFGPRLLNPHGFTEHKVDQAWIIDRGRRIEDKRIDDALALRQGPGRHLPLGRASGGRSAPTTSTSTRRASSSATTSPCSTWRGEFKADCLGWQYQLGLIPLRPPSDFAEGLLNSTCRPESNGDTHRVRDRGRPGQRRPDGADEAPARSARACTRR